MAGERRARFEQESIKLDCYLGIFEKWIVGGETRSKEAKRSPWKSKKGGVHHTEAGGDGTWPPHTWDCKI